MRKHQRRNNGPWKRDGNGDLVRPIVRIPTRRQHGLLTNVAILPSVVAKADKRRKLYMHSAARNVAVSPGDARSDGGAA